MALDPSLTEFTTTSPIITTFDFTDIADGTGVVVFYGMAHEDNSGVTYSISRKIMFSPDLDTSASPPSGSFTKVVDVDFDITFDIPKTIKGKVVFQVTQVLNGSTNGTVNSYLILRVRKFSGSTETELANVQTPTASAGSSQTKVSLMSNLTANLPTRIHFKSGDILRITVESWGKDDTGSPYNGSCGFAHSPKNRTISGHDPDSTIFEIHVPFKINL